MGRYRHAVSELPTLNPVVTQLVQLLSDVMDDYYEDNGFKPGPAVALAAFLENTDDLNERLEEVVEMTDLTRHEAQDQLLQAGHLYSNLGALCKQLAMHKRYDP